MRILCLLQYIGCSQGHVCQMHAFRCQIVTVDFSRLKVDDFLVYSLFVVCITTARVDCVDVLVSHHMRMIQFI